jgi:hypothetical protein
MSPEREDEIYLETQRLRSGLFVRAVSADDGLEVSFQAPRDASEMEIERLARAKLGFVRRRQRAEAEAASRKAPRGGIVV